jgi:hypothetical protein
MIGAARTGLNDVEVRRNGPCTDYSVADGVARSGLGLPVVRWTALGLPTGAADDAAAPREQSADSNRLACIAVRDSVGLLPLRCRAIRVPPKARRPALRQAPLERGSRSWTWPCPRGSRARARQQAARIPRARTSNISIPPASERSATPRAERQRPLLLRTRASARSRPCVVAGRSPASTAVVRNDLMTQ